MEVSTLETRTSVTVYPPHWRTDDWFSEPARCHPPHAENADYELRLQSWGWLRKDGTLAWEPQPRMRKLLQAYIDRVTEQLNQPVYFGYGSAPWWYDPTSMEGT